jgi:tRNA A37 threonylcarbamoyladenosine dehydratase
MFKKPLAEEPMEMDMDFVTGLTQNPVQPELTLEESFDLVLDRLDSIESKLDILIEKN